MKVYIDSYGCTFNKADGQIMAGVLNENDIDLVDNVDDADVIIVNTCYVIKVIYYIFKHFYKLSCNSNCILTLTRGTLIRISEAVFEITKLLRRQKTKRLKV